jgi:hypothetical protein
MIKNAATAISNSGKGNVLKNAIYIASAMVWVSITAAHLIREQLPQSRPPGTPVTMGQTGQTMRAMAVAPWEKRCGKVYVQKVDGQPDQKSYRPCLMV